MKYLPTIDSADMRDINRTAVLEIIRREGPISRSAIVARLDVSLPTVMRIVDELIADGLVTANGTTEWSGGRRRPLLEFNPDESVVLGVDLGGPTFYGAIADLGGNILDEVNLQRNAQTGEGQYEQTTALIDLLMNSSKLSGQRIRGIGVGVPGVTDHKDGVVNWAYTLQWSNFPLCQRLTDKYHLPLIVDNDMNLAALGEMWFGEGQEAQNMILLTVSTGIGAGIILDRALYRGSTNSSGEIGYMLPGREFLGKNFGEFGALESNASFTGILNLARKSLGLDASQPLSPEEIFEAAERNETWAKKLVDEMIQYLAVAIANLTVVFDPDLIILCGDVTRFPNMLVDPILKLIGGCIPKTPKLVVSKLGRKAVAMGAVANVLHNTSNFFVVQKLS